MHPYSIDTNDKFKGLIFIIPLSLFLGYITSNLLKNCPIYESYSWIIDSPSSGFAFFGIFYSIFDGHLWKFFSSKGVLKTPIFQGVYEGQLYSSRDGKRLPTPIKLKIEQTLSRIKISLSTELSSSKSEMAAIFLEEVDGPILIYEFINDHRKVSDPNLSIHRGLTRLTFNVQDLSLIGTYYTSPERQNFGEIKVFKNKGIAPK